MRKSVIYNLFKSTIFILLFTINSYGLNIISDPNYTKYNLIYATGRFESGDLNKIKRAINSLPNRNKQSIVVFDSIGGVLSEGIKIGKYLYRNHIGSAVKDGSYCASSCAIAFLGGRDKYGNKLMILPRSSRLGYHDFYYKQVSRVNESIVRRDYDSVENYFHYVGAPTRLMNKMFKTDSSDMYWITHYSNPYLQNLKKKLPVRNRVAYSYNNKTSYQKREKSHNSSQESTIKKYFKSVEIALNTPVRYSKNGIALNTETDYTHWLENNLKQIFVRSIKLINRNTVDARVVYVLKNGIKFSSKNRYKLAQNSRGWQVVSKRISPSSHIRGIKYIKSKLP
jgi:hypothetical protein